jgi:hypothetical protein
MNGLQELQRLASSNNLKEHHIVRIP